MRVTIAEWAMEYVKAVTVPIVDNWAKAVAAQAVNSASNAIWGLVEPAAAIVSRVVPTEVGRRATTAACA
jgi:uncharacterized protein (UPF0333 family)